jgi:hypothetical protein
MAAGAGNWQRAREGAAEVGDWVLKIQRAVLYRLRADTLFGLPTLVCGGRKRILGLALKFFLPFTSFKGDDLRLFLATTHK